MIFLDFLEDYCNKYKIEIKERELGTRLKGQELVEFKILNFILKTYYHLSFVEIGRLLNMSKQNSMVFYYGVLENGIYRELAKQRWQEYAGDIQANIGFKTSDSRHRDKGPIIEK